MPRCAADHSGEPCREQTLRHAAGHGNAPLSKFGKTCAMHRPIPTLARLICLLPCLASLCACGISMVEPTGALAAASIAAVPVFGRTVPDIAYSAATGQDCSMVRLEQGRSYCRPTDPPWPAQPVCTRSLALVECWQNPQALGGHPITIADGPQPTAEQEAYRTRRWPF